MSTEKPSIKVTDIAEYIRYKSCDRRFKLKLNNSEIAKEYKFIYNLIQATSLDLVLEAEGHRREKEWKDSLEKMGLRALTQGDKNSDSVQPTNWNNFVEELNKLPVGQKAYGREISIKGNLGEFNISGTIDFAIILWEKNEPKLRLVECKASRKDRTYHQVQVAVYRMIVRQLIKDNPVTINQVELKPENIECVVVRIDENTNKSQDILQSKALNLDIIESDINRLLASDGSLYRIVQANLADLDYELDQKCSDCTLSVHCLAESARERRLELLGLDSSIVKSLHKVNINNIDDLANIDLTGNQAIQIQQDISFTENLELLKLKAETRRHTLPDGDSDPDTYDVQALPNYSGGQSQLPQHTINEERLIRIYLSVEYDYVENRIGALAAHVTKSKGKLDPKFIQNEDGKWQPHTNLKEYIEEGHDENNNPIYKEKELEGEDLIESQTSAWTGDYKIDTGSERQLIQGFLRKLVGRIAKVARTEKAPIHFYVWSRQEMTQLVEGCSRVDSQLLSNLRELLGCRESLEQLIYSCLYDEVDRRYALGWTGRDLAVVTSLKWFGRRYHWKRDINGQQINLDQAFSQDVFDFKTNLEIDDSNHQWATPNSESTHKHPFEVRLRYFNSLSAAYWRALWDKLPSPNDPNLALKVQNLIKTYNEANKPNYLEEYFRARTHAIRWIEEGIRFKNSDITKESLVIADLSKFNLGIDGAAQAAIDFLRLDQHVKVTDWIASHLIPPIYRISLGRTIPVKNVVFQGNNKLTAEISFDGYNITSEVLQANCTIAQDSFVRLSPSSDDPHKGQTINQLLYGGSTCVVKEINWDNKQIELSVIPGQSQRYQLYSKSYQGITTQVFQNATLDESPSDFVAGRVDQKLQNSQGNHVCQWLAPQNQQENIQIPAQTPILPNDLEQYENLLQTLSLPNNKILDDKQKEAVINGLNTRIQLLQGPPGTGKTETTAIATFIRILARRSAGDIVIITAHTHTAVDNLLLRLDNLLPVLQQHAAKSGFSVPSIQLGKVYSKEIKTTGGSITDFSAESCFNKIKDLRGKKTVKKRTYYNHIAVIGGTTGAILKMLNTLQAAASFSESYPQGFQTTTLIVDEASMMVFPHFLALATLVRNDGEIMLAGDPRQLAPIVTHDWEKEDRPPVVFYQPYVSAYQAIQNLKENSEVLVTDEAILRSSLDNSFRLPYEVRKLIDPLYQKDDIQLKGREKDKNPEGKEIAGNWEQLLQGTKGLYLVLHSERESKRSNQIEVEIIKQILETGGELPDSSTAILTPHRAQRSLLKTELATYGKVVDVIDTVEKVQGGERDNVIVSATASNPSAISKNVEFILSLNRSNVAFSRAKKRLIIVCSKTLLDYIPTEIENYQEAILWKNLRSECSKRIFTEQIAGHTVDVFTNP
ncbi:AAA domain-containing protein [Anabaena sp. UHCC 0451]|uniref:AAA domain-containing protein n=1 Tax=Anabaena sp. UHCC 0451 TaxID=2055235 RepID=UPI002B1FF7DB|nr:AAA domain-containing protein [Anabaena sp. UHCC 0451]MEA5575801.1 AAA domain-containing protein [Anabaena sp. UHCC 0451]